MDYTNEYLSKEDLYSYNMKFKYLKLIHSPIGNIMVQDPVFDKVLRIIHTIAKKSDVILDYGCGWGYLTKKLRDRNYCIVGCDIVKPLIDRLNDMWLSVFHADDIRLDRANFDLILLLEVLEHVPDPVEFLKTMIKRFPNSKLLISVPNANRIPLSLGIEDIADKPPHHYTQFNVTKLISVTEQAGYKINYQCEVPIKWNEAIYGTVLKLTGCKTNKSINKYGNSGIKIFCYIMFFPVLYVIGSLLKKFYKRSSGRSYLILAERR